MPGSPGDGDVNDTTPPSGHASQATDSQGSIDDHVERQSVGSQGSPSSAGSTAGDAPQMAAEEHGSAMPELNLHSFVSDLRAAFGFFTRLPVRPTDIPLADAVRVFPLVGGTIGVVATVIYGFGLWIGLSSLMSAILAVAATSILTGGLHEDGLADFADMLGVRGDHQRKLAVMRDSTIGTYGVLALVFVSLMKVAAISELAVPGQVAGALISAHALGRGVLPLVMRSYPLARSNGLAVHAGKPPLRGTYLALGLAALIAFLVGGPGVAVVATLSALVAAFLIAHIAYRHLGGYSGDVLGAAEQMVEMAVIMNFVSFT